jgi:hypothetical protein
MRFKVLLPAVYAVLFVAAMAVFFAYPSNDGLSGVYAVILTIPWSVFASRMRLATYPSSGVTVLWVCAALNCSILYLFGVMIDRLHTRD